MKKSSYLLVLLLLVSNFLDLLPFTVWMSLMSNVVGEVVLALWMVLGLVIYRETNHSLYQRSNNRPTWLILGGVLLSMIPIYLYYGQGLLTSIVAYRVQYFWLFIPAFLYFYPSEEELIRALNIFSVLYVFMMLINNYVAPSLFYISESVMERWDYYESEMRLGAGYPLLLVPFYYYCDKIKNEAVTTKHVVFVLLFFLAFFLSENRSTLFIAALVLGYVVLTKRSRYKVLFLLFASIIVCLMVYFTAAVWASLFTETAENLNNEDYNRIKAFNYFLFEANTSWVTAIFGNGFLSAQTSSMMQDLMELGIYNSDLGMIGYWHQFGIIPVATFLVCIWRAFRARWCPFYVKAVGFHIFACALTISYFGTPANILWFVIFYYLYVYHHYKTSHES